jgi:hypothetical protein
MKGEEYVNQPIFCRHLTLADEPEARERLKEIFPRPCGGISEIKALRDAMQGCKTTSNIFQFQHHFYQSRAKINI